MQRFQLVKKPLEVHEPFTPKLDRKTETKGDQAVIQKGRLEVRALQRKNVLPRGRRRGSKRKMVMKQAPSLPPDLAVAGRQILSGRYRFDVAIAMPQVSINDFMLLGAVGAIGTVTNTTVASIASAVRLRRITVWPASGVEVSIFWASPQGDLFGAPDVAHDQTIPTGITTSAPVTSVPPSLSPAALWHQPNTSPGHELLVLTCGTGSVIDVELDYTLAVNSFPILFSVATAVQGHMYYLPLDGAATHRATALGRPSTF